MSSLSPYLHRRGFSFNFRIAVPRDLRPALGLREVTKALPTNSKSAGALLALEAAVVVKRVFAELRARMENDEIKSVDELDNFLDELPNKPSNGEWRTLTEEELERERQKQRKAREPWVSEEKSKEFQEKLRQAREQLELDSLTRRYERALAAERDQRLRDAERARLEGEIQGLRRAIADLAQSLHGTAASDDAAATMSRTGASVSVAVVDHPTSDPVPTLDRVAKDFLTRHRRDKPAMLKKHQTVLPLLIGVVGNKPITEIKQADIKDFLNLVQKLPPRWSDECRRRKITAVKLAQEKHVKTMSPKTFDDTYKASLRVFLKDGKAQWQDQGFPTTLTTDGVAYQGDRREGENKQRAFREDELERLLNGPEMAKFAVNPELEHRYWMVYLGFYTGARVNELCQINPQVDVLQEAKTDIWHVAITEDTEGDERIKKSVKNEPSRRKVPLHPRLIEMGFLQYATRMKAAGAKLLFPEFKPSRGRASSDGEKWFRTFLRELGLRDETTRARLVGMHAFRHTLLTLAYNSNPRVDATPITGHRGGTGPVVAGYQDELSLENKLRILKSVQFGAIGSSKPLP
jgi:integrase